MTTPLTLCSIPGCPTPTPHPPLCPEHRGAKNAARGSSGWERQARTRAFLTAHPLCAICDGLAHVVDHVTPLSLGGADSEDNWQALCAPCHTQKSAYEAEQSGLSLRRPATLPRGGPKTL